MPRRKSLPDHFGQVALDLVLLGPSADEAYRVQQQQIFMCELVDGAAIFACHPAQPFQLKIWHPEARIFLFDAHDR